MKKTVICVIGMHRSGTSATTRVINLLGIEVGDEATLLDPQKDNPKGFWENKELVEINDEILSWFGREWDTSLPIYGDWWKRSEMKPYREKIIEVLSRNLKSTERWVWKDPRTSILLPLYNDIIKELGIDIRFIICVRNPLDVHNSLMKRDNFSLFKSIDVWKHYTISSFYWTRGYRRLIVHFDRLLDNRELVINEISKFLEIEATYSDLKVKEKIDDFLCKELRHSQTADRTFLSDDSVDCDSRNLYREILKCLENRAYLESNQFNRFISSMYQSLGENEVYLWGAGEGGRKTLELLNKTRPFNLKGIIDNDFKKQGRSFYGYTVYSPSILNNQTKLPYIMICSIFYNEIVQELCMYGYQENDYRILISPFVK
ncbi:hypothetical protein [Geobacillus sp. Geo 8.1]